MALKKVALQETERFAWRIVSAADIVQAGTRAEFTLLFRPEAGNGLARALMSAGRLECLLDSANGDRTVPAPIVPNPGKDGRGRASLAVTLRKAGPALLVLTVRDRESGRAVGLVGAEVEVAE